MSTYFIRRHCAKHFYAIIYAFTPNHFTKLCFHLTIADNTYFKGVAFFLKRCCQLDGSIRMLPSYKPAGP